MIDTIAAILPSPPKPTPAQTARGAADDFRTTLETVADKPATRTAAAAAPEDADTVDSVDPRSCGTGRPGKGQGIAGGGKTLPGKVRDEDETKALIWLPVGMIALPPSPAACPLMLPRFGGVDASAAGDAAPANLLSPPEAGAVSGTDATPSLASPNWAPAGEGEGEAGPIISKDALVLSASFETANADAPVRVDALKSATPQIVSQPVTQLAGQAFAVAIAAAVQTQPNRDEHGPMDARTPLTVAGVALQELQVPAVAATADAKQAPLDLGKDSGLQGMIDHIELLRDNADAGDTRIRLVPDALGAVDVAVRKDGERVHVHFSAENAASARLLTDAQPRLAELADARGVKLGQTSVDSGTGHARQQPPAPILVAAPPAARADAADPITDIRIA
jgi:flagellar hook-length control protein FliK